MAMMRMMQKMHTMEIFVYISPRCFPLFPVLFPIILSISISIDIQSYLLIASHRSPTCRLVASQPQTNQISFAEPKYIYFTFKMFTAKTITAIILAASAVVSAAPTGTTGDYPSKTVTLTGVTHTVKAGLGGLRFDPDNVVAEIGDVVEWHYLPKNHTVTESSFGKPCQPKDATSFHSGFQPTMEGQAPNVFQIVVKDTKPIWYYCAQPNGFHCRNGMTGVINQNFDSDFTLAAHRELAADTGAPVIPPVVQGGYVIPNPNPLSGF
jgi:plastocyanin